MSELNNSVRDYKIDIVFVLDATGSMGPILEKVRKALLTLPYEFERGLEESGYHVSQLRVKMIDFADFASEGSDAIHESRFMTLPDELSALESYVANIRYKNRGGDVPENALEALYTAMQADWTPLKGGQKGRHIIVLITDAPPLKLGERTGCEGYRGDFPASLVELEEIWNEEEPLQGEKKKCPMSYHNRRLVLYVPDVDDWKPIEGWEWTVTTHIRAAGGFFELNVDMIISDIVWESDRLYDVDDE